ncbi:MAG: DNA-protecting protein DprA [Clostridiales bacterium]|nr:DNA-protecting protein DprA [Clostridiales bacterium]
MASIKYWVWLSAQTGVSPAAKAALLRHYGDAETAFFAPAGEFGRIKGISAGDAAVLESRDMSRVEDILAGCRQLDIRPVTMQDADYPERLRNIFAPPAVIYVKGKLPELDDEAAIAVIGTRKASPYGLKMGSRLAGEIVRCGGIVISGLTSGIDAAAARGALLADGVCIGVLGTSHDMEKGSLARDVCVKGALISEYPPGTQPLRSHFRDRNRISAGLSVGVTVVEAPEKSGALLFAAEANDQGKEIFAVPGNADAPNSAGTIALMQEGAKPVRTGWDILCEFADLFPGKLRQAEIAEMPENGKNHAETGEKEPEGAKKGIDKEKSRGYIDLKEQLARLSEEQLKIISAIDKGASHIDDVIENTGLSTPKVLAQLTVLEIKGFIRREPGKRISLNTAKK